MNAEKKTESEDKQFIKIKNLSMKYIYSRLAFDISQKMMCRYVKIVVIMVYMDSILALKDIIFTCPLPPNCRIDGVDITLDDYSESRTSFSKVSGIRCDLNDPKYEFKFRSTNKTKFSRCVFTVLN